MTLVTVLFAGVLLASSQDPAMPAGAAPHPSMPAGMSHEEHLEEMRKDAQLKARGAGVMGFDQDAAVHHFRLLARGGAIEVDARDAADSRVLTEIRAHLRAIA